MENIKRSNDLLNTKLDIKIKLSILWVTLMFLFVYADLKAIYQTGTVESIIQGDLLGMKIDDIFLLISAILMSLPAIMITLSVLLKPKMSRVFNIIVASLFIIINIATYFTPGRAWYYYIYFTSLETIICIIIIMFAWRWPKN